jgi:hypothetical protein
MPAWQDYILGSLLNVTAQITEYIPLLVLFHTHIDQTTAKQHLPDWKLKGANKHMLRIHPTKFEATQIGVNKTAQAKFLYFCPFPRNIYEIFILYWLLNTVSIIHYLQFIINYFLKIHYNLFQNIQLIKIATMAGVSICKQRFQKLLVPGWKYNWLCNYTDLV